MQFVGGDVQGEFVARVRGRDPQRCLVVPIDVGKHRAEVLVADLYGEVVSGPLLLIGSRSNRAQPMADDVVSAQHRDRLPLHP